MRWTRARSINIADSFLPICKPQTVNSPHFHLTTTNVHELLECPVCTNSMYPPIHQCHNGHTLCSTCKTRVHNQCPTCRQELGDIRCLALEKVAESLELPCKYRSLGCPEIFPYSTSLNMNPCVLLDHTIVLIPFPTVLSLEIFPSLFLTSKMITRSTCTRDALSIIDMSSPILEKWKTQHGC